MLGEFDKVTEIFYRFFGFNSTTFLNMACQLLKITFFQLDNGNTFFIAFKAAI